MVDVPGKLATIQILMKFANSKHQGTALLFELGKKFSILVNILDFAVAE